ncbi:hypothetical protein LCGC14_3116590, partial [marine sediment metagenome]
MPAQKQGLMVGWIGPDSRAAQPVARTADDGQPLGLSAPSPADLT